MTESFQQGENLSADKLNRNFKEVDNINGSEFISVNRTSGGKQVSLNVHSLEGRLSKSQIEYGKVLATYKPEAIYITLKPCYPSGTDFPYTVNERWKVHLTSNRDYPKDIYYAKDDVIAFKRYANPIGDIVGVVIGLPHQVVFALELCENSSTVQLTNDISFANALDSVVKLDDNHCYKCRLATQAEKAALTIKAITSDNSLGVFDTCSECNTRYLLTQCSPGTEILCSGYDLSASVNKIIKLKETVANGDFKGLCFTVTTTTNTCDAEHTITINSDSDYDIYNDCNSCLGCWHLTVCNEDLPNTTLPDKYILNKSFTPLGGSEHTIAINDVLRIEGICWTVADRDSNIAHTGNPATNAVIQNNFASCETCDETTNYKLTPSCIENDCNNESVTPDTIVTGQDFSASVGKWVKVNGICYLVSETTEAIEIHSMIVQASYETCNECLYQPVNASLDVMTWNDGVPQHQKVIITNGEITKICPPVSIETTDCIEEDVVNGGTY